MAHLLRSTIWNKNKLKVIVYLSFVSLFYSCTTSKTITYFQGKSPIDTVHYSTLATIRPSITTIQPDDILAIIVTSLSDESNILFNFQNTSALHMSRFPGSSSGGGAGGNLQPLGYLVDSTGSVNIPLIGKAKLAGLTIAEAEVFLKDKLDKYLKEPTINVRPLNHKFTVLGEVNHPGVFNLINSRTTLPEVVGMAGELTVYGRRDNVMLIRTVGDKREVIRLDLTARSVLDSPYYFIQNNDILYVEPRQGRVTSSDRAIQLLPMTLGIISTLLVVVNFITK
ncbi:ligand-binding protein [Spirosoma sp. HMF4905]|uniref:Ligand-binding protein n=1 Tax=Spirosoma arboris TaxID=2682092 RepID=A0A7K1SFQ3_9BACT|nr:polysaccharide biosynthesis/export family protein [Spirosoma arboris]MVM32538.1 ligand-binding protein [Spirosoma arboris]